MPIYKNNPAGKLDHQSYFDVFEQKGVKYLTIKTTKNFKNAQGRSFELKKEHVWSYGDTLYKLSQKNYGVYDYWWTIGLINGKPTDAHYKIGDVVYIPRYPSEIQEVL